MEQWQLTLLAKAAYEAHHEGSPPRRWDGLNDWERDDWERSVRAVLRYSASMVAV